MNARELKDFLDEKANHYEAFSFIKDDPILIPHQFSKKEDIEISAFLVATISWGNRKSIINSGQKMMALLDQSPYDFVINHQASDLKSFDGFVHRTFNADDFRYFVTALQFIYHEKKGLEALFTPKKEDENTQLTIHHFKNTFFQLPHQKRTQKHVSDPLKGSAAKRINMFLRWMVRSSKQGVDFGLWKGIEPRLLSCPLDVHSGNVARKLGLLQRQQNDAKALMELDTSLRQLDPLDPVKYDFALFGLGVFEQF